MFGETDDATPIKYYQVEMHPYYEAQLYINSIFNMERLWYNEFIVDLAKFRQNYFFSLIVNGNLQYCWGDGYEIEAVDMSLSTSMKFMDCYKTVISDICQWKFNWSGIDAKWFDECSKSSDAQVDIKTYEYREAKDDFLRGGTVYPTSVSYCRQLPGTTEAVAASSNPIDSFARMSYTMMGNYIKNNYGHLL